MCTNYKKAQSSIKIGLQQLTSGDSKAQWTSPTVTYSAESHSGECSDHLSLRKDIINCT